MSAQNQATSANSAELDNTIIAYDAHFCKCCEYYLPDNTTESGWLKAVPPKIVEISYGTIANELLHGYVIGMDIASATAFRLRFQTDPRYAEFTLVFDQVEPDDDVVTVWIKELEWNKRAAHLVGPLPAQPNFRAEHSRFRPLVVWRSTNPVQPSPDAGQAACDDQTNQPLDPVC